MARTGIGYQEVALAAEKLVEQNVSPTIERIRVLLGTGSYSTVSKYLMEWKTNTLKKRIDALPVNKVASDPINLAVANVWEQLQRDNATRIEEIEAAAHDKIQAAQTEKEQALEALHQITKDNQDLRALLQETREQNAAFEEQNLALNQALTIAESKLAVIESAQQKFQAYADNTLASLEEKYQQARIQYDVNLSETKQFYSDELSQMKEIAESQRHQHIVEIDHLKTNHQKLQAQLVAKDKSLSEITRMLEQLNTQFQTQQGGLAEILIRLQHHEKTAVALSHEFTEGLKQEVGQQSQKIILAFQRELHAKEAKKPGKGKGV